MTNFLTRFSDRVENYIKYRPSYPSGVLDVLRGECGAVAGSVVADIGSGTGILTAMLLEAGCRLYAVEPNGPMREAAERQLGMRPEFSSISATAENTTLPGGSVDLITAAQAFHWFEPVAARAEFARILKPGGFVALVWNRRRKESSPFLRDYEQLLLRFGTDYTEVHHDRIKRADVERFFHPAPVRYASFPYVQKFDLEGARGRLLSSSFIPAPGQPGFDAMMLELNDIFAKHQTGGTIDFEYDNEIFYGQFHPRL